MILTIVHLVITGIVKYYKNWIPAGVYPALDAGPE